MISLAVPGMLLRLAKKVARRLRRYTPVRFENYTIIECMIRNFVTWKHNGKVSMELAGSDAPDILLRWRQSTREDYVKRLHRGDVCFLARIEDVPLAYVWIAFNEWKHPQLEYTFPLDKSVWLYDVFSDPAHRRQGVYATLLHYVMQWLEQRGYERVYGLILRGNVATWVAHKRGGFLPYQEVAYRRLGFLAYQKVKGGKPNGVMLRVGPLVIRTGPGRPGVFLIKDPAWRWPWASRGDLKRWIAPRAAGSGASACDEGSYTEHDA